MHTRLEFLSALVATMSTNADDHSSDIPARKRMRHDPSLPPQATRSNGDIRKTSLAEKALQDRAKVGNLPVLSASECPYLATIERSKLDFDHEHVCSVSLSRHNVYACLVCGTFYAGRSTATHAYAHALDAGHHVFLNLRTAEVHVLPEQYIVRDPSLSDIVCALHPTFSDAEISRLDVSPRSFRTLDGSTRVQGAVGLDNLRATDYAGVIFQLIISIPPVRNFLLKYPLDQDADESDRRRPLLSAFSMLARKVWSPIAFRAHVSPHEIMQIVSRLSHQRFGVEKQKDPVQFLAWLLNTLTTPARGTGKRRVFSEIGNVLRTSLQGSMAVNSYPTGETESVGAEKSVPFWFLALELPPKPLFKDSSEKTLVPQVPLSSLLNKYNGQSRHHVLKSGMQNTYRLEKLPSYLILHVKRFVKSKFAFEKNPCVVHLPVKDLQVISTANGSAQYRLEAAVIHDGELENGVYRIAIRHRATANWYEITDTSVRTTPPQLIGLAETYILLYSRDSELAEIP